MLISMHRSSPRQDQPRSLHLAISVAPHKTWSIKGASHQRYLRLGCFFSLHKLIEDYSIMRTLVTKPCRLYLLAGRLQCHRDRWQPDIPRKTSQGKI